MKKIISILLMCLPLLVQAQTEAKYLAGSVPTEDGKVVFRADVQVNALKKADLYATAREWANERFQVTDKFNARVVYDNYDEGRIAAYGEEYLVFSASAISLDRAKINYQLQLNVEDGKCELVLSRIRYTYHESEKKPDRYQAEEWITDEVALNKAQTKLMPICGKFRRKTIDLKDDLARSLQNALGDKLIALNAASATPTEKPVATTTVATAEVPANPEEAPVTRIPQTTAEPVSDIAATTPHHLMVTAGDDEQFKLDGSSWGGEGKLFGKHVSFLFIDTQKMAANLLLVENNHFTLQFYQEGEATPYATQRCKKMSAQQIAGSEAAKMNPSLDAEKSYNMFVGEIVE